MGEALTSDELTPRQKTGYAYNQQLRRAKARVQAAKELATSRNPGSSGDSRDFKGFPVYAQQYYTSPFGATGNAVCVNCHLSTLTSGLNLPNAVSPDTVFESILSVPLPKASFQLSETGTLSTLNVGGLIALPEGFSLPAKTRLPRSLSRKTKGSFIQPYTKEKTNLMLVGPVESSTNGDLLFPALTPMPDVALYQSSEVVSWANRGRGQIYPSGVESNSRNILVKKSRSGRVLSRILGSYADEIKLSDTTSLAPAEDSGGVNGRSGRRRLYRRDMSPSREEQPVQKKLLKDLNDYYLQ